MTPYPRDPFLPTSEIPPPPPKSVKPVWIALGVVAAICLVFCGVGAIAMSGDPEPKTAIVDASPPPGVPDPGVRPSVTPPKPNAQGLKMGTTASPATGEFTVTALKSKTINKFGERYDGVSVRFCTSKTWPEPIYVSTLPWSLIYEKGEARHGEAYTGIMEPEYPYLEDRPVSPGSCVKGWISFTDIAGKPEGIEYRNDVLTASWKIP